jgi:hypothetical protein
MAGSLPYASELYGIYQPLLGWKSAQVVRRIDDGQMRVRSRFLAELLPQFTPRFDMNAAPDPAEARFEVRLAELARAPVGLDPAFNSIVARRVAALAQEAGAAEPGVWRRLTQADELNQVLAASRDDILTEYRTILQGALASESRRPSSSQNLLASILRRESVSAGALAYLGAQADPETLMQLLPSFRGQPLIDGFAWFADQVDPAQSDLARAVISPIGMVHLFREYFFEFDTFLGPSVQHLWLSPGGMVELIEVSTRKTLVEQTTEQVLETTQKSETSTTNEDELSDAVRAENSSDTKLGVSATATLGYNAAFVSGSGTISGSFNMEQNQKQAREQTHRSLRQQTEKLSSEIRKSFKSTFRTVTETTDMTSRRYVIQNTTDNLVNYELRRKMRQVGVQVQDYGTRLCWQSIVDDPGDELGVGLLVHIAEPPNLQDLKEPDKPPQPEAIISAPPFTVTVNWPDDDDNTYYGFVGRGQPIKVVPPKPGYVYASAQVTRVSGEDVGWGVRPATPADVTIDFSNGMRTLGPPDIESIDVGDGMHTEPSVNTVFLGFQTAPGGYSWDDSWDATLQITLFFRPSQALLKGVNDEYNNRVKEYSDAKSRVFQETLFKEARDRVTAAAGVKPRPFDELRDEERTVVYRCLIRQLLAVVGITNEDHRVRHVFAELVQSLFDVDRMLYFVAPEWWMPRFQRLAHQTPQDVGLDDPSRATFSSLDIVSWGGAKEPRPDNYFITEDSAPAKLGSSLGWLIQLDGDNLRNAFLNAPWVKAVIPIRTGRELRAIDWLSSDQIEGSDGLDALYDARDDAERQAMVDALKAHTWDDASLTARYAALQLGEITILDAIRYLVVRVQAQQAVETTIVKDANDPSIGYLPTDMVFENGFDPLLGGFRIDPQDSVKNAFEIFDQWIEILPTDQIVPVEVTYDPITGMQKP